jgi:hypothetical protein
LSEATTVTRRISIAPDVDLLPLLGRNDDHLRTLESELDAAFARLPHAAADAASEVPRAMATVGDL